MAYVFEKKVKDLNEALKNAQIYLNDSEIPTPDEDGWAMGPDRIAEFRIDFDERFYRNDREDVIFFIKQDHFSLDQAIALRDFLNENLKEIENG